MVKIPTVFDNVCKDLDCNLGRGPVERMDRGEKIVALAYEMMEAENLGDLDFRQQLKTPNIRIMLCLAVLFGILTGSAGTWAIHHASRPVNKAEAIELEALTHYIAKIQNMDETSLRTRIERRYAVHSYAEMTASDGKLAKQELEDMLK